MTNRLRLDSVHIKSCDPFERPHLFGDYPISLRDSSISCDSTENSIKKVGLFKTNAAEQAAHV